MTCTFFGHRDAPAKIKPILKNVIVDLIENKNVNFFYIGNNGAFDRMARELLKELKNTYKINYCVALAYIPKKQMGDDYTDTIYYDELNTVPYRLRIIERNKLMLEKSDIVVTYVAKIIGNAADFKALAERKGKTVINISLNM